MANPERSRAIVSLGGLLRPIFIPVSVGFEDPREIGRAMVAWKYGLSRQEVRILEFVARGLTNIEIAGRMGLDDENRVKQTLKLLFSKLRIRHRAQAAHIAAQFGICGNFELEKDTNE